MKTYVTFDKARVAEWVYSRLDGARGVYRDPVLYQALGIEENGKLIAGAVFDQFSAGHCWVHVVGIGRRWLTRTFMEMCCDYIFNQAGCKVAMCMSAANNAAAIEFTQHIGHTEVGRVKDGCGDSDLVIFALHRDDCRWLRRKTWL